MPWYIPLIASAIPSIFGAIFGGGNKQTTTAPSKYDPIYAALSPAMLEMLTGNWASLQGAGFPGGSRNNFFGTGNTMLADISSLIQKDWPKIVGGSGGKSFAQKSWEKYNA